MRIHSNSLDEEECFFLISYFGFFIFFNFFGTESLMFQAKISFLGYSTVSNLSSLISLIEQRYLV